MQFMQMKYHEEFENLGTISDKICACFFEGS